MEKIDKISLFLLILSAGACTSYRERFKPERTDKNPEVYLENRHYILERAPGKTNLIGYVESYKKVVGLNEETNYFVYDKNYNKIGYVDDYGGTYKYTTKDEKKYIGTGRIEESCRMLFDLPYSIQIILESVH